MNPSDRRLTLLLLAGCVLLFTWRLGDRDLWNSHEARAAMNARSVLEGEWALPRLHDGRRELQKPPLYYWLVAAAARVKGGEVDGWAVRLPSALAALGCVLALVLLVPTPSGGCEPSVQSQYGGLTPPARLIAGVVLATSVHFTWLARVGRIDMPLTAAIALALLLLERARHGSRVSLLGAYLALAAALLLKGPIGLVLPLAVWCVWRLVERDGRGLFLRDGLWWGVPLVLAIVLPWCLWANQQTQGEWFRVFVWFHNVERGLGGSRLRSHSWWFYGPQGLIDLLPWSLLLVPALVWWLRRGGWRDDPTGRFGLVWSAVMTLVLSLARYKRADYLVPAYPGFALFLGSVLERWLRERSWRPAGFITGTLAATVAGWAVYLSLIQVRPEPRRQMHTFAASIRRHAPAPTPVVLFQTENHLLAFHLGRPLVILVDWEELRRRASHGVLVVLPAGLVEEAERMAGVRLTRVGDNLPHEKPLVLVRIDATDGGRSAALQGLHGRADERTAGH